MSQSQSEGATVNLRPNLDPRILPGSYCNQNTKFHWLFQATDCFLTFSKFQISFNIPNEVHTVQSLLSSNHLARSQWPHVYRVGPQYPYITSLNPICCVTAEAFPRLWLMDILSVRKEKEKFFILWLRHMEALQRRALAVPHQIPDTLIWSSGQDVQVIRVPIWTHGYFGVENLRTFRPAMSWWFEHLFSSMGWCDAP